MSDSAKLRFVYALIFLVLSFFNLAAIVVLSILIGFKIIPSECSLIVFFLVVALGILFINIIGNLKELYYIGIKEGQ